ncbi:MAG: tRNA preQ1(34) S-adenosylmethionine ribosyltransferase-isomerase QueA [Alicyclobacillaceae bacterium]|nr:tRNA preQ1(34) S-adenosylmethionine ribosyltransferase-isomerase QueA [Alicyclobacillaceae bacterium]
MRVDEFDYELPEDLIAQTPLADRADSRLMVVDPVLQTIRHEQFRDIARFLVPGDVLVFNDSKVIPARLYAEKADSGARVELLLLRPTGACEWEVLAKPARRLRVGTVLRFVPPAPVQAAQTGSGAVDGRAVRTGPPSAVVTGVGDQGLRRLRFEIGMAMDHFLEQFGTVPLPPYIRVPLADRDRYQTVYARLPGSVAAPTAGLHFTVELLAQIRQAGVETEFVTLHVGLGTFRPVQAERVEEHVMHREWYCVPETVADAVNRAKREGRRVVAVGTTALRTLEAAGAHGTLEPGVGDTDLFVYPGYRFRIVDALITNFHLPKSTLIMLVAAMMGKDFTLAAYREAVARRYRFFSFGDAMFITRRLDG